MEPEPEPFVVGTRDFKVGRVLEPMELSAMTVTAPAGIHHVLNGDHMALCEQDQPGARAMHPFPSLGWTDTDLLRCDACEELLEALAAIEPESGLEVAD